jgi:hypothetical protein
VLSATAVAGRQDREERKEKKKINGEGRGDQERDIRPMQKQPPDNHATPLSCSAISQQFQLIKLVFINAHLQVTCGN